MYLSTYEERENGSVYEDAYEGHNLSKLNLCDEGELLHGEEKNNSLSLDGLRLTCSHHMQFLTPPAFCYFSLDL